MLLNLNIRFPSDEALNEDENAQTLASLKSAEVLSGTKLELNDKKNDGKQKPMSLYQKSYDFMKSAKNSRIDASMIDKAFTDETVVQMKEQEAEK